VLAENRKRFICVATDVEGDFRTVFAGFDERLFRQLNPPFPPVNVQRFDGVEVDDEVHLELNFLFFRQTWISRITESESSDDEIYFTDEGTHLPFFLSYWRHRHRVVARIGGASVIDEITFASPNWLLDLVLLPALYLQFLYRKPLYKRFFRSLRPAH